jgi:hypothetical protein
MSTNVERVLDQIRALTDDEQQQVRTALNSERSKPVMTEDEFEQHLLEAGVISEVKPPNHRGRTGTLPRLQTH